jgi:capsular polysaccharide biosynthesis protein
LELREYWDIIRRRWWLPVIVTVVAAVASTAIGVRGAAAYKTDLRIAISTVPTLDPNAERFFFDTVYYSNLTSEYLADDMSELMHSSAFAGEVKRELATSRNLNVDIETLVSSTRTKKTHRFIDITITTATPELGQEIGGSISRILSDPPHLAVFLKALTAYTTQMTVVTPPDTHRANTIPGLIVEISVRTLIGLLVGIGLAFLLDYLDSSVRSRHEAEALLRLPVLAEIPRPRSQRGVAA